MATIWVAMLGNMPDCDIVNCNWVPVATWSRMVKMASVKTMLPAALATESIASTSGTPAANMVDSVRA